MLESGRIGVARSIPNVLELMATYDNEEDVGTIGATAVDLTSGTLGDKTNGVGDGLNRNKYFARGFHNYTSSGVTVAYRLVGDSTQVRKTYIGAGGEKHMRMNVKEILGTGDGTTAGLYLKVYYKERGIVDNTGPMMVS